MASEDKIGQDKTVQDKCRQDPQTTTNYKKEHSETGKVKRNFVPVWNDVNGTGTERYEFGCGAERL
jgi:hypothetical protein